MTTPLDPLGLDYHIACLQNLMGTCLSHAHLQDELYCQLLRQLSGHTNPSTPTIMQVAPLTPAHHHTCTPSHLYTIIPAQHPLAHQHTCTASHVHTITPATITPAQYHTCTPTPSSPLSPSHMHTSSPAPLSPTPSLPPCRAGIYSTSCSPSSSRKGSSGGTYRRSWNATPSPTTPPLLRWQNSAS